MICDSHGEFFIYSYLNFLVESVLLMGILSVVSGVILGRCHFAGRMACRRAAPLPAPSTYLPVDHVTILGVHVLLFIIHRFLVCSNACDVAVYQSTFVNNLVNNLQQ